MTLGLQKSILFGLALLATMWGLLTLTTSRMWASHPSEYEVKAAYLYNFGRFVEWPPNDASGEANEFDICVLGRDPFGMALDATISGEKIGGKKVVARRISAAAEGATCRVLFISSSEDKQVKEILANLGKLSVLTVSDMPEFIEQGGMVQFILANDRVRFQINLTAAQQARLNLSSELLKVAAGVTGTSKPMD